MGDLEKEIRELRDVVIFQAKELEREKRVYNSMVKSLDDYCKATKDLLEENKRLQDKIANLERQIPVLAE